MQGGHTRFNLDVGDTVSDPDKEVRSGQLMDCRDGDMGGIGGDLGMSVPQLVSGRELRRRLLTRPAAKRGMLLPTHQHDCRQWRTMSNPINSHMVVVLGGDSTSDLTSELQSLSTVIPHYHPTSLTLFEIPAFSRLAHASAGFCTIVSVRPYHLQCITYGIAVCSQLDTVGFADSPEQWCLTVRSE
jgi:hypothetical protein